jgi:Fe-S-cluster-containing hydrogenase component 2
MGKTDGFLNVEEVKACPGWPGDDIIDSKRVAVLECVEDIPCNPCEVICPKGAIKVGTPITNLPIIDGSACDGCTLCIPICPGLAIFVIEKNYREGISTFSFPYELLPLPEKGDVVGALNRKGEYICEATVVRVSKTPKFGKTTVVTIAVPKEYIHEVRSIRVR